MKIIYSYNKRGYEADYWSREIAGASTADVEFIPFNHDRYLDPNEYIRAQLLDHLYFVRDSRLLRLYSDLERVIAESGASAVLVDNCFPYHPEYLLNLKIYKVLRTSDGPLSAYDRDFAHLHAYDHVLYHSPAYSPELSMEEKLRYCGARKIDFWPLALFDASHDPLKTEDELMAQRRDIDVVFIGAMHLNKMPFFAKMRKALKNRLRMHGLTSLKRNLYFNVRHGFPGWVREAPFEAYVPLYQRSKIGINVHNRGEFSLGNFRLFDLPGNGVLQISDGGDKLGRFFEPGLEIEGYTTFEEMMAKIDHYLTHEDERAAMARLAFRRVKKEYGIKQQLLRAKTLISAGMSAANATSTSIGKESSMGKVV